jgi:hypothetical protein
MLIGRIKMALLALQPSLFRSSKSNAVYNELLSVKEERQEELF